MEANTVRRQVLKLAMSLYTEYDDKCVIVFNDIEIVRIFSFGFTDVGALSKAIETHSPRLFIYSEGEEEHHHELAEQASVLSRRDDEDVAAKVWSVAVPRDMVRANATLQELVLDIIDILQQAP